MPYSPSTTADIQLNLLVHHPTGREETLQLEEGSSLTVGSNPSCDLCLDFPDVSAMHCVLKHLDGQLWIQSWNDNFGTWVNGQQITVEHEWRPGDQIQVGACVLAPYSDATVPEIQHASLKPTRSPIPATTQPATPTPETHTPRESTQAQPRTSSSTDPVSESRDACAPAVPAASSPEALKSPLPPDPPESSADVTPSAPETRPAQPSQAPPPPNRTVSRSRPQTRLIPDSDEQDTHELNALLRAELDDLQIQIALRDERITELLSFGDHGVSLETEEQPGAVEERIVTLNDELDRTDERVATLQELLSITEEANLAEQEERQQIQAWIDEVEIRLGQREGELVVENQILQEKLEQAYEERNHLEMSLEHAVSNSDAEQVHSQTLETLRQQNTAIADELEQMRKQNDVLQQEVVSLRSTHDPESIEQQVNELVRVERLEIAQERAAMARQRASLAKELDSMEDVADRGGKRTSEPEQRFQAFRQHLKEIHQKQEEERKEQSLASRLTQLWRRVEG